jgi:hypothetical protein
VERRVDGLGTCAHGGTRVVRGEVGGEGGDRERSVVRVEVVEGQAVVEHLGRLRHQLARQPGVDVRPGADRVRCCEERLEEVRRRGRGHGPILATGSVGGKRCPRGTATR